MPTDAARIIAGPIPVTIGGEVYELNFDFEALLALEDSFDGLANFLDSLNSKSWRGRRLRAIRVGLRAGMSAKNVDAREFARVERNLIGPGFAHLTDIVNAINEAFSQAVPPPDRVDPSSKA